MNNYICIATCGLLLLLLAAPVLAEDDVCHVDSCGCAIPDKIVQIHVINSTYYPVSNSPVVVDVIERTEWWHQGVVDLIYHTISLTRYDGDDWYRVRNTTTYRTDANGNANVDVEKGGEILVHVNNDICARLVYGSSDRYLLVTTDWPGTETYGGGCSYIGIA